MEEGQTIPSPAGNRQRFQDNLFRCLIYQLNLSAIRAIHMIDANPGTTRSGIVQTAWTAGGNTGRGICYSRYDNGRNGGYGGSRAEAYRPQRIAPIGGGTDMFGEDDGFLQKVRPVEQFQRRPDFLFLHRAVTKPRQGSGDLANRGLPVAAIPNVSGKRVQATCPKCAAIINKRFTIKLLDDKILDITLWQDHSEAPLPDRELDRSQELTLRKPGAPLRKGDSAIIAATLAGAWRQPVPISAVTAADLYRITPALVSSGVAAIVSASIASNPDLKGTAGATELHNAFRYVAMQASVKERVLEEIVSLFAAAGMEPMVIKGWAIARYYSRPHLRPFGDFDLCAPPGCHQKAVEILERHIAPDLRGRSQHRVSNKFQITTPANLSATVDLHPSLHKFRLPSLAAIYDRSIRVEVNGHVVRTPCLEDHIRLAALHFLNHGGWRPLWLVDIAAMLDHVADDFDWDMCLGQDPETRRWICCVLELSGVLLGARLERVPSQHRIEALPQWIVKTVLHEWRMPLAGRHVHTPMATVSTNPKLLGRAIAERWPNALRVVYERNGTPDEPYPLRHQLASFSTIAARFSSRAFIPTNWPFLRR